MIAETPLQRLDRVFTSVLGPVRDRVPAADFHDWVTLVTDWPRNDWSNAPEEAETLQRVVSARLERRATEPGGLDNWARAAGLVTALAVLRATGLGCNGLRPYLEGAR